MALVFSVCRAFVDPRIVQQLVARGVWRFGCGPLQNCLFSHLDCSLLPGSDRSPASGTNSSAFGHHCLGLGDRVRQVEAFRAGPGANHDRMAAIESERVFEPVEAFAGVLIATVGKPTVRLQ